MALDDFLRNRPAPRANPAAGPRENILALLGWEAEMVEQGRLVSHAVEWNRRERAARLDAIARGPDRSLDETWELLGTEGLLPAAWFDGTPRFVEHVLRKKAIWDNGMVWRATGMYSVPRSLQGVGELAMAGGDVSTIEALWLEARTRLGAFGQRVDDDPAPLWGWHDWQRGADASPDPGVQPSSSTFWPVGRLAFSALTTEARARGQRVDATVSMYSMMPFFMNRLDLSPPPVLPSVPLRITWSSVYGHVRQYAIAWELAASQALRVGPYEGRRAGVLFSDMLNPFVPLAQILRLGYGWTRCTPPPTTTVERPTQHRVALLAPALTDIDQDKLFRDRWWTGERYPDLRGPR